MDVRFIDYKETKDWILNKHYAGRMPSVSFSFGLFFDDVLFGIMTVGKPSSPNLCEGICGKEFSSKVYELNRLVVNDGLPKNTLSEFVSKCLKLLKIHDLILVSYADSGMNHNGYIYQATNWIYTGMTKERTDKWTENGKHSRHYKDGNEHLRKVRTAKHRYVYFNGLSRKIYLKNLKYKIAPYPKGENKNYILGDKMKDIIINTKDCPKQGEIDIDNVDTRKLSKGLDIAIASSRVQEFNTERDKKFKDNNKQYVYRDMDEYAKGKTLTNKDKNN
ncbi:MAG: hypothetical protein WCO84_01085 [bacterium]